MNDADNSIIIKGNNLDMGHSKVMILLQGAFKASHQYVKYEPNPFKGFGLNFIIDQIKAGKVDKSKILDRVAVLRFCNCLKCLYLCMQLRVMLRTKTRSLCSENVLMHFGVILFLIRTYASVILIKVCVFFLILKPLFLNTVCQNAMYQLVPFRGLFDQI